METYEQKYKEALEKARMSYHTGDYDEDTLEMLEIIFPELKESEDERIRKEITELVMHPTWRTEQEFHRREELVAWLEKQGEQKPAEWSTEDLQMIDETLYFINEFQKSNRCVDEGDMQNSVTCEKWLKSLKPQPHWKPSEEQMKAVQDAIAREPYGSAYAHTLHSLYNDLSQLK